MWRSLRTAVICGVAFASFGGVLPLARSVCAGPAVTLRPRVVQPGDEVELVGRGWSSICDDSGGCSIGCLGETCDQPGDVRPIMNLRIELEPRGGGPPITLSEDVDADASVRFRVDAVIPAATEPGRYVVRAVNDAGHEAVGPTVTVKGAA
jgi:hypothetical protein